MPAQLRHPNKNPRLDLGGLRCEVHTHLAMLLHDVSTLSVELPRHALDAVTMRLMFHDVIIENDTCR